MSFRPSRSPRSARALARILGASAAIAFAAAFGCGSAGGVPRAGEVPRAEHITPVDVRDEDFAASLFGLIRDGTPSAARDGMLVGVVRRQLAHAAQRFAGGRPERATDSVIGAMYLVRSGEGRSEMVDDAGGRALAGTISRLSARGDEGRSVAFMKMRAPVLRQGSPERAELMEHISALEAWMRDTRTGKPIRRAGAEERARVARSLVDPSPEALNEASKAVGSWIDNAIQFHAEFRQTGERPAREDAVEAARALESGGLTMAAIFLRHGDAKGALEAVNRTSARRLIQPEILQQIAAAATDGGASDWQGLAAIFAQLESAPQDMETGIEPAVLAGALWGVSLEAYRRDPTSFGVSMLVARSLVRLGMSEAAPLVLAPGLGARAEPRALSAAMELIAAALSEDASIEDIDAARRTFRASAGVLALVERSGVQGRVEPSAAQARFMMASIELRSGNLTGARPLLEAAAKAEPSVSGYTTLAMVERQAGESSRALDYVGRALAAPDARREPGDVAEALLLSFEVHRDTGSQDRAKTTLDRALEAALAARRAGSGAADKARAERLLGRVLDGYGDAKGAARALERALQAAGAERPLLGATVLDAVGRAFVRRDVEAARAALKHGIEGEVAEEELVYGGLWLMFLERERRVPTDGTAERALQKVGDRASWVAKLAAWATGKLSDAELAAAAQNAAQRVEVAFYTAMARKVAGDPGADERLRAVSKSPVIDLLEVHLARELLAPRMRAQPPGDLKLP